MTDFLHSTQPLGHFKVLREIIDKLYPSLDLLFGTFLGNTNCKPITRMILHSVYGSSQAQASLTGAPSRFLLAAHIGVKRLGKMLSVSGRKLSEWLSSFNKAGSDQAVGLNLNWT